MQKNIKFVEPRQTFQDDKWPKYNFAKNRIENKICTSLLLETWLFTFV